MNRKQPGRQDMHPAQRFVAPATIQHGVPLARLIGRKSVELLAESMVAVAPRFDAGRFVRGAVRGLGKLGLMERAAHVAGALAKELPSDFNAAAQLLVASFGPELAATEGTGLAPFFYLPHSEFIAREGKGSLESGMWACYELTKRFTAEFCIRPFLADHQAKSLGLLQAWISDPNPHVRRLVSEGTRPRLPWGRRLRAFQADPHLTLPLLEELKDDPEIYVQRSVANHLADILKDNPAVAYTTCERWIEESSAPGVDSNRAQARLWIVRHALRLPAKKGEPRATRLRSAAQFRR
ncbi:MAG: hypothetical protein WD845_17040 [Pirellulales bacterium]